MAEPFLPANADFESAVRQSFAQQGVMRLIGAEMIAVKPGACDIRLPFSDWVSQQHGFFHGGLIATVADSAGGYAAMTLCPAGTEVLTVEFKVNFLAPAKGSEVIAVGRVIKPGRTLMVCGIDVDVLNNGVATRCAIVQQTMMAVAPRG
jgi:uncharacterized protein (TIGR00369 family)